MAPEEHTAWNQFPHGIDGGPQALLILLGAPSRRRPSRPHLTKRKITAQHKQPGVAKGTGKRQQESGLAVRPGSVGEYEAIPYWICGNWTGGSWTGGSWTGRAVQVSADGRPVTYIVVYIAKWLVAVHSQGSSANVMIDEQKAESNPDAGRHNHLRLALM